MIIFFFNRKTQYEMLFSDCSSDVCSSDLLDPDQSIVERLLLRLARVDRGGEAGIDVCVAQLLQQVPISLPERFEDHGIGALGTFKEGDDVKPGVGGGDRAHAAFDHRHKAIDLQCMLWRQRRNRLYQLRRHAEVVRLESLLDTLLLVSGPLATPRIEP